MKRQLLLSLVLMAALLGQAQTALKVAPQLKKGYKVTYKTENTTKLFNQKPVTVTSFETYEVVDETADGFVIENVVTEATSDVQPDDIMGRLITIHSDLTKGIKVRFATNKEGRVEKLLNFDEVKQTAEKKLDELLDEVYKEHSALEQVAPKTTLRQQSLGSLTEDAALQALLALNSVLALNGKTLQTGSQDEFTQSGTKMKAMYFVNGKTVTANAAINMSKEELKEFLIKQIKQLMPDQADMIIPNIDMAMESGMLKFDIKTKANFEMLDNGWVNKLTVDGNSENAGQKSENHVVVTLTEKNF